VFRADEFEFRIPNGTNPEAPMQSVKDSADGTFEYALEFKTTCKYELVVKEVKGELKDIIHNERIYKIIVDAIENVSGVLKKMTLNGEKIVFENKTVPPNLPSTRSDSGWVYLFGGLALIGIVAPPLRKRKHAH
jgi:hypothetical protein